MRIIAGRARGARLAPVPGGTRPLADRAREGLFSSLGDRVPGARCVDLFAGTGAVGLEALSRGAASCVLVDSSSEAVRTIGANLERTGLEGATVVRAPVDRYLRGAEETFDLGFLDPPYALPDPDVGDVLAALQALLTAAATVALTRHKRASMAVFPVNLQVVRRLDYGDARILVLEAR